MTVPFLSVHVRISIDKVHPVRGRERIIIIILMTVMLAKLTKNLASDSGLMCRTVL